MLVDHHCHLDFPDFDAERAELVERAASAGVTTLVSISTRIRELERLLGIVAAFDNVFCSVGTHPHNADSELDIPVEEIVRLSDHPKVVAIGEAGLDYHYKKSSPEGQAEGLQRHIKAARITGLPLVIHSREADADMARILEEAASSEGPFTAVLHCFTAGAELARRAIALGHYVSFSGVLTFKNAEALRAIAAELPLDRLLVETDSPYLAPPPYRGKRNEPAFVVETARVLAKVRGMSFEEIAAATTRNAFRLYAKLPRQLMGALA
ncbi:MAG: TatD family deoxyribonuclease [Hyphomicrobiaceae bacterium]|nr:MAG: TatD family deoxyribonuclease [Hyphomicrobiaceae bacterium]